MLVFVTKVTVNSENHGLIAHRLRAGKGQNMAHLAFHSSKQKAMLRNAKICIYYFHYYVIITSLITCSKVMNEPKKKKYISILDL